MKKAIVFGTLCISLLFTVLPALATIRVNLENPANGTRASGITALSGWAFSDTPDTPVSVWLRLNGVTTQTEILCCGPRQDVQNAYPAAPPNSGFGLLWNYGVLPSGVHTIGVEVRAAGEEPVMVDSGITVVRPADAEVLGSLSIEDATVTIDEDDGTIVITGAEATPKADQATPVTTTLTLAYSTAAQAFGIALAQDARGPARSPYDASQLLEDVAGAIFDTYDALHTRAADLQSAVLNAVMAGDRASMIARLATVQTAWREARVPWEQSEAFLFGPVDTDEHDPALDSWPLNTTDLENIIASNTDIAGLTLEDDTRGFHALEYLLFQDQAGRTDPTAIVASLLNSDGTWSRRSAYAQEVLTAFVGNTGALRNAWDPEDGNFVRQLAMAGRGSTNYTSQKAAVQELVNGMIGIADEVANTKLAVPLNDRSTAEEESRFSNNSRRDFIDNLRSINNIYEGRFDQTDGTSMGVTDFVANQNPELDVRVRAALREAIAAVIAIPEPFGQSIMNDAGRARVQAAVDAGQTLHAALQDILPLVSAASFAY